MVTVFRKGKGAGRYAATLKVGDLDRYPDDSELETQAEWGARLFVYDGFDVLDSFHAFFGVQRHDKGVARSLHAIDEVVGVEVEHSAVFVAFRIVCPVDLHLFLVFVHFVVGLPVVPYTISFFFRTTFLPLHPYRPSCFVQTDDVDAIAKRASLPPIDHLVGVVEYLSGLSAVGSLFAHEDKGR